jgi:hypothetical protein
MSTGRGGRGGGHSKTEGGSLAEALGRVGNDRFFAGEFVEAHVMREYSPEKALEKYRAGKNTTVLFLDGDSYKALADEVRAMTKKLVKTRKRAFAGGVGNPTFTSQGSYSYVTIFDQDGTAQPGKLRHGHLVFATRKVGEISSDGQSIPLFAINHCEAMKDVKHPDVAWEYHEHPGDAAQSIETENSDEDDAELSEGDADDEAQ